MILGKHDNGYTYLCVRCNYTGDDRIFFDSLIMRVDGVKEVKKYERAHDQIREDLLLRLLAILKVENGLTYEDTALVAMQINTSEKMDMLKEWLKTKWSENRFHLTPNELLNKTAEISRM